MNNEIRFIDELLLLRDVYKAGVRLRNTAPVDDDFGDMMDNFDGSLNMMKHAYETKINHNFIFDEVRDLFDSACIEANKASTKFPQPNYVITKVAEEAGEVVKEAVHCAEGRGSIENLKVEIKQCMAMLIRLYVEGDQVHGLEPLITKANKDKK